MLELNNIVKKYSSGDNEVLALNGVNLKFRKNEFVSILGASGCGKTTMLNIIGGLDRYTDGDLVINGVSTKEFKDRDWDTYRNHSIGFVFQSYNLIPHQSVLSNVELALTLSGVSKSERRQRAKEALQKVGLGDQLHKKPSQMSGGQMQRVAIARALVNNPEILLADEPTGALDTTTSVQIMELLKAVAADRLVIMVTHNPELAAEYSTRIVRLSDGVVIDDTQPYEGDPVPEGGAVLAKRPKRDKSKGRKAKTSMSFLTALSLSMNNLLTKKGRTALTSFAGSIGIIGIALVLALSTGIQEYIDQVQEDTLSTYPLSIYETDTDMSAMMGAMTQVSESVENQEEGKIYVDDSMGTMMSAMTATVSNNLEKFKIYLDENYIKIADKVSDIQYTYDFELQVFSGDGKTQISPTTIFDNMGDMFSGVGEMVANSGMAGFNVMSEMINNQELLDQQYEVVAGQWPEEATDVVLVVSKNNQLSLLTLYMLGELDQSELEDVMNDLIQNGEYESPEVEPYTYDYFLGKEFYMLTSHDFYSKTDVEYKDADGNVVKDADGNAYYKYVDDRKAFDYDQEEYVKKGTKLKISGIIRPKEGATASSISGAIGYTKGLTDLILEKNEKSSIINQQKAVPEYNVLTGLKFEKTVYTKENIGILIDSIDNETMSMMYAMMSDRLHKQFAETPPVTKDTFVGFTAIMDDSQLASLVDAMMKSINAADTTGTTANMVCGALTAQLKMPDIAITQNNILTLIPSMTREQKITTVAIVSGFCSEETMNGIYDYMNEQLLLMEVNDENFVLLLQSMKDEEFNEFQNTLYDLAPQTDATLDSNLTLLGDAEKAKPASINFYAKDFESKDGIETFIKEYNDSVDDMDKLQYTDVVGLLMSSVSTIINVITYVLIAFVSISLIVSSIMIGIITYISVVERTKEIGILRAIGASKRDISRVFNAETLIVGLISGAIGIIVTLLLIIPINAVIHALSGIAGVNAILPWQGALILVLISMVLTIVAGLFPSRIASKKDPVEALRSE